MYLFYNKGIFMKLKFIVQQFLYGILIYRFVQNDSDLSL